MHHDAVRRPQAWAAAFDAEFDGIRYQTRFTTVPTANAAAVFGPVGGASLAGGPRPEPNSGTDQTIWLGYEAPNVKHSKVHESHHSAATTVSIELWTHRHWIG